MPEAQSNNDLQGALLHFAVQELVRHQREEFPPLWTRESWAKFLIWLALQCGAGVQQQELEAFAHALGPVLTGRLRRLFFERELGDLDLKVMADPAEAQVLVMPLGPARPLAEADVQAALGQVKLTELVLAEPSSWQQRSPNGSRRPERVTSSRQPRRRCSLRWGRPRLKLGPVPTPRQAPPPWRGSKGGKGRTAAGRRT